MNINFGGLFNNLGKGLVGGVANSFKREQAEQDWLNENGWFGSLLDGQKKENEYMAANKERIPMILEYLTGPLKVGENGKYTMDQYKNDTSNRCAIVMYINPSRLQFNNQKLTQKSVTRGGIFYHHWGDDHTILSISGDLGLASMSGVKKLDEVYRMSGNLLAYGENTAGPVYWDGNTDLMNAIYNGDFAGALAKIASGKMSLEDFMRAAKTHTIGAAIDAITGRKNNGLQGSKIAQASAGSVAGAMQKLDGILNKVDKNKDKGKDGGILNDNGKYTPILNGVIAGAVGALGNSLGKKLGNKITKSSGCLDYLDQNVVTYADSYGGFSDIIDELEDPWRPRLVWIYFEDHVYIGHFQSFNYTRDAASVNIHYDLQFVVQREVIITSYRPKQPGFDKAEVIKA